MKLALKTTFILLLLAGFVLATPLCVNGSPRTMAYYKSMVGPCEYGGVLFSNFTRPVPTGNTELYPVDGAINVVFSTPDAESIAISFQGIWGQIRGIGGNNTVNDSIGFVVDFPAGGFTGLTLKALAAGQVPGGSEANRIDESLNGQPLLTVSGFTPGTPPGTPAWYSRSALIADLSSLTIGKSIHLAEGNGKWGYLTDISQIFNYQASTQPVPEPGTLALVGLALGSVGVLRKRITRKQ